MSRSFLRKCLLATVLSLPLSAGAAKAASDSAVLDEHQIAQSAFGGDASWYENNIPFFDSSDSRLNQIYYYRWKVFRAHQRDLGAMGYITTEFLQDVSWQRDPYASLNDATAFHIQEGRWLRDQRYVNDYINYMYQYGGNDRHFSEGIAGAVYQRFLAQGETGAATRQLQAMIQSYDAWKDHYDSSKQLYWIEPLYDATEYTISSIDASGGQDGFWGGQAFRPSINAYMYANAQAISRLAALKGDQATASDFAARAANIKARVLGDLWDPTFKHFTDRYQVSNSYVHYWDRIRGRELVGYLPWAFGMIDDPNYAVAWSHILDSNQLAGPFGLRTNEPSYQYYMRQYRYDWSGQRECQWNGPAWPFQTTQVLQGLSNLLHGQQQQVIGRADYLRLLRQYADLHMLGDHPDLQEDYDPATGKPIVGLSRSHHYEHSAFDDLIVTGFAGLVPHEDDVLDVDPLIPNGSNQQPVRWFALQNVPYHGHLVSIVWDADGSHYRHGAGLRVLADGAQVGARPDLGRITVPLARKPAPRISQPLNLAVNLVRGQNPIGSASVNADAEALHQALDGRVWFFPEVLKGWSTAGTTSAQDWFAVDFGQSVPLRAAELAFYSDGQTYVAPPSYHLQYWDGDWHDVPAASLPAAVANGVTRVTWPRVTGQKLRLVVDTPQIGAVLLVQLKAF